MRAEASYVLLRTKNICTPLSGVCCASTTLNMHDMYIYLLSYL
jgi:hypothetical protein